MPDHRRDEGIKRRDFINGMLIAAGTASVGSSVPMRAFAQLAPSTTFPCDGSIGTDPNVTRGARTACAQLLSAAQANAFDQVTLSPVVTANVTIRSATPVVDLGYDAYYWGSQYWADFVVADWVGPNRNNPNRQTVLTFYGGNTASVEDQPNERIKLLTTPFSSHEDSLRADMNRVLAGRNFDFDRDVIAMYLYRWGHSMVYPKPGWPFSAPINKNGQVIRVPSPRFYARQQIGRISFGAQDVESSPANESAIGAGVRTSGEVLPLL